MEWSKAKNIIIGMLIAVNIFLLFICFFAERNKRSVQETEIANTVSYLQQHGTVIDPSIIPTQQEPRSILLIERDDVQEAQLAETLIDGKRSDRTGGTVRFSADDGSKVAIWRAGGLFEANTVIPDAFAYTGDLTAHPAVLKLAQAGAAAGEVREVDVGEHGKLLICQYHNGLPIFNATLTVTCGAEDIVYAAGRLCVGVSQPISAAEEMGVPGLLIRFAEQMADTDADLTHIKAIRPGYVAQNIVSTGVRLIPAWEITTPSGAYYINAVEGTMLVSE